MQGDRRLKMARQPESRMDSGGLTKDTRDKDLSQSKRGARESNVDSEDTKYRKEVLNTITAEQRR